MQEISNVSVWEQITVIPTYRIGSPEKNPIFSENRVYQGSSGVVYPYPVIEKISDEKYDKPYRALFLENKYLKIMVLPELGGRIQMAYDKIKGRHFIYYNRVIKPALVGLTGPWISGGIEFNWPQHHRPSTFEPIDYSIEEHEDGSKTVWVNEVERMSRTKGMAGFRLYPDKAYLEINVKLYNRTPFPQTFLWWANPAVKVNDHYQSVFPPDVHAVYDHGKRAVSEFPIAKGTYYKVDYSNGVDISRYKNIPVPTSYMAIKSKYDFMGGFEHDTKGGVLHVASHHISPGKKQWTWGNGAFGFAWDRHLTDEDGPYVELMTGVFTDNQPDFSWIHPFEERTFTQYFMPYSELGIVKNANKNAMVNIEVEGNKVFIKFYTTTLYENAKVSLFSGDNLIWSDDISISPELPVIRTIKLQDSIKEENLRINLQDQKGKIILQYQTETETEKNIPEPAKGAKDPAEIESIEQLFLTGLHIEQYRHATYKAIDYYQEALRREATDVRNNNAMGLWFLKRGKLQKAEQYFRTAIHTLTDRNPNPNLGEPYFNLGLCLFLQDKFDDAYDTFYKATWNAPYQDASFLNLARIAVRKVNFEEALDFIDKALKRNYSSGIARHLKVVILRKLDKNDKAQSLVKESIALDQFNYGCLYEEYLLISEYSEDDGMVKLTHLKKLMRNNVHTYIEYALDYMHAGLYDDAKNFMSLLSTENGLCSPMLYYYLGYCAIQNNEKDRGISFCNKAAGLSSDYCFPNRIEDVKVLGSSVMFNPEDSKAFYYLGNFSYANGQYFDAITWWEKSSQISPDFPTVHRNLALAYHNKQSDPQKALQSLEKAFQLDRNDARVLMELDQLYKRLNKPHAERLKFLETYLTLVNDRDDLYLERITLYNHLKNYHKAKQLLFERAFHPWEGGEGNVVRQYLICHMELAKHAFSQERYDEALLLLEAAETYPENLGEGKLFGTHENDLFFWKGCVNEAIGNQESAKDLFERATVGLSEPVQAVYYNDQQPDKIFYMALAWKKLGEYAKGKEILKRLINFGANHIHDKIKIDYFAVSLPDLLVFDQDQDLKNKIHCHYMIALGYLGLGNGSFEKAEHRFNTILNLDINHFGAAVNKNMIQYSALV